jgi:spore coat protein A, manganese oxidase
VQRCLVCDLAGDDGLANVVTEQHPFHIHLAAFQVDSIGGNDPGPHNHGWKDTVSPDNGDFAELLVRFDSFKGKYVFHCHNLEREDMMMMGNVQVS